MKKRKKGAGARRTMIAGGDGRRGRGARVSRKTVPSRSVLFEQPLVSADGPTVVGIGASAGGLEAFSQLLEALPDGAGLALVLVQHLAPQHESALPALLGPKTRLPVRQVTDGMRVEADHVYVIPPNVQMEISD